MIFEKQVVNMYKGMMHKRCDDTETVFYFSQSDFPGLCAAQHRFVSSLGHVLVGYFYKYEDTTPKKLIVFDHGFGGGHRAYMKDIDMLARHGYLVFAYDHTGCMESGGDSPNGLSQSLCDLNDCITMLKEKGMLSEYELSVMGHSWGAFSTLNIAALHPEVSHIVAISGFVSVEQMINTFFSGIMKGYRKPILDLERRSNPSFVDFNATKTLSEADVKALLIYSDNDTMCRRYHYDLLLAALGERENVELLLVEGKGHNPNYTKAAVEYLEQFSKQRAKLVRRKNLTAEEKAEFVKSFDWQRMTEQDGEVWDNIFRHLDS